MKVVKGIHFLLGKAGLNSVISGCKSHEKEEKPVKKQLLLSVTKGFFQGSTIPLEPGRYTFGRYPDTCNILFPMRYNVVSRVHLTLVIDAAYNVFITDLSSHGTWVNNIRLMPNKETKLAVGSIITFGEEEMMITSG